MEKIILNPEIRGGKPVFKGTRISPLDILAFWKGGLSNEEILEEYPSVKPSMIEETRSLILNEIKRYREELKKKAKYNRNFRRRLVLINRCLEILEKFPEIKNLDREELKGCFEIAEEILIKSFVLQDKEFVRK